MHTRPQHDRTHVRRRANQDGHPSGGEGQDALPRREETGAEQKKITKDAVRKMMERQERERQEGSLGADETLFPEGAPQRHINWQKEGYELFVGYGHGASAIRVGELQEDPLTRFLL